MVTVGEPGEEFISVSAGPHRPCLCRVEFFGHGEFGYDQVSETYYTELELGYRLHPWVFEIDLYGGIEVFMDENGLLFSPFRDTYTAGGILRYGYLYFIAEHKCIHSVYSKKNFEERFIEGGSRTRFGIGFEF